jgi:mannitol/fructose-specific phosphotransferase system IIA component (Ntr-type)
MLSHIARLTIKTDVLDRLRSATSAEQVREAITVCSAQLEE